MKSCEKCKYGKKTNIIDRLKCSKTGKWVGTDELCEEFKRKKK